MTKENREYVCRECGHKEKRAYSLCSRCNQWDTFDERIVTQSTNKVAKHVSNRTPAGAIPSEIQRLSEVTSSDVDKWIISGDAENPSELDKVLGGGIVKGSLVLIGGEPGAGKTTALSQVAYYLSQQESVGTVLCMSGEESNAQVKMRADRLNLVSDNVYVVYDRIVENLIEQYIPAVNPSIVVLDSISIMYSKELNSMPNSSSQLYHIINLLTQIAKTRGISFFIIAQLTKGGDISGTKQLEHMVDTVMFLENDEFSSLRVLRAVKNRFGASNQIGILEMTEDGLVDVKNPSEALLSERAVDKSGSAISVVVDGYRPLMVEIQSLVSKTSGGYGTRRPTGINRDRLTFIAPVVARHSVFVQEISDYDIFVNAIGGIRVDEPAADLAIAVSIVSSYLNIPVDKDMVFVGETLLTGNIKSVPEIQLRVQEAAKIGFSKIVVPKLKRKIDVPKGVKVIEVTTIEEALKQAFLYDKNFSRQFYERERVTIEGE